MIIIQVEGCEYPEHYHLPGDIKKFDQLTTKVTHKLITVDTNLCKII